MPNYMLRDELPEQLRQIVPRHRRSHADYEFEALTFVLKAAVFCRLSLCSRGGSLSGLATTPHALPRSGACCRLERPGQLARQHGECIACASPKLAAILHRLPKFAMIFGVLHS